MSSSLNKTVGTGPFLRKQVTYGYFTATAQSRRVGRRVVHTADVLSHPLQEISRTPVFSNHTVGIFLPTAESFSHAVDSFTGMADASSRTVGSASHTADSVIRTADSVIRTAGSFNRMAEASNRMVGCSSHTAGRIIRMAGCSSRTAEPSNRSNKPSSRTNKSFIRTGKSSSRTVFCQKHAKNGKNHTFPPSSRVRWSKNDSSPFFTTKSPRHQVLKKEFPSLRLCALALQFPLLAPVSESSTID